MRPITSRVRRCLFTRRVYNGAPPRNDYRRSTIEGFIVPFAGRVRLEFAGLTTRETNQADPSGGNSLHVASTRCTAVERCSRVGVPIPLHLSLRCFIRRYLSTDTLPVRPRFCHFKPDLGEELPLRRETGKFLASNGTSSFSRRASPRVPI